MKRLSYVELGGDTKTEDEKGKGKSGAKKGKGKNDKGKIVFPTSTGKAQKGTGRAKPGKGWGHKGAKRPASPEHKDMDQTSWNVWNEKRDWKNEQYDTREGRWPGGYDTQTSEKWLKRDREVDREEEVAWKHQKSGRFANPADPPPPPPLPPGLKGGWHQSGWEEQRQNREETPWGKQEWKRGAWNPSRQPKEEHTTSNWAREVWQERSYGSRDAWIE